MKTEFPLLSVIIPTFNCERYVGKMIDSIINQTFTNWELILVDDGSTDRTCGLLNEYQNRDGRVKWYKRDRFPKGACTCRNVGFEKANNPKYVIWFDADDVIAPYCFEQRVDAMDSHPEMDFMVFPAKSFCNNPNETTNGYYGIKLFDEDVVKTFLSSVLPPFIGWTNIYRRESVLMYNLKWDENLLSKQDTEFNLQSVFKGCSFMYAENADIDYYYRKVPNSIASNIVKPRHFASHIYLLKKISNYLLEYNSKECNHEYLTYTVHFARMFAQKKQYEYLDKLLKIDLIKNNHFFSFRIKLLKFLPSNYVKKVSDILFPMIYYYNIRERYNAYCQYSVKMAERSL